MSQAPNRNPTSSEFGPAPIAPVRPVNSKINSRILLEPRVRFPLIGAALIILVALYLAGSSLVQWRRDYTLIKSGTSVSAKIDRAAGIYLADKKLPPDSPVTLSFKLNNTAYSVDGFLDGRTEYIITGTQVNIRVDPDDPRRWTYRSEPRPMIHSLLGSMIVFPLCLPLVIWGMLRRKQMKRLWTHGQARPGIVLEVRHSALAPSCKRISAMNPGVGDRRMYRVFVPQAIRQIQKGDSLWLIVNPDNPSLVAAAVWFD